MSEIKELDILFDELWPICRSITGQGLRDSLRLISKKIPFEIFSVPSHTRIFDWKVPQEWSIKKATLKGPNGKVYADFSKSNLSVLNYSTPINKCISLEELQKNLFTIPELPDAIPYVTSYYKKNWGFCLKHSLKEKMPAGLYECIIDSLHFDGELNYGEYLLKNGEDKKEILISSYLCHPSLANNELSGPLVMVGLYNRLKKRKNLRFNYRFYLGPETIGSLCFLKERGDTLVSKMVLGIVCTCLGGKNKNLSAKLPRDEQNFVNKFLKYQKDIGIRKFTPTEGSDERQFCSPGFNLPVINIVRDVYGEGYVGYHNSLDNKDYMGINSLVESIERIERLLIDFEESYPLERVNPYGEPQLGKRDLYSNINSRDTWTASNDNVLESRDLLNAILWILSLSDGKTDIYEISKRSEIKISFLKKVVNLLITKKLIK